MCHLSYVVLLCFSGDLRIPSHVSVLHVEQEVVGNDTLATESVLECDTQRAKLIGEEKEITDQLNLGQVFRVTTCQGKQQKSGKSGNLKSLGISGENQGF